MENNSLIEFAEEKVNQFKNDLLTAKPEVPELCPIVVTKLIDKKNDYWGEIMAKVLIHTEADKHDEAYEIISKYHAQFQNLLQGFIKNKDRA